MPFLYVVSPHGSYGDISFAKKKPPNHLTRFLLIDSYPNELSLFYIEHFHTQLARTVIAFVLCCCYLSEHYAPFPLVLINQDIVNFFFFLIRLYSNFCYILTSNFQFELPPDFCYNIEVN